MAIDKAISYRQQAAFGGIMGRDGRRMYGGGSDMGSVADSQGNVGPGTGGYQGGPLGGYGDAGSSNNPSGDRYRESRQEYQQAVNTAAAIEAAKIEAAKKAKEKEKRDKRDAKNKNITKFGYAKPKSKVGGILGTIAGMMLGIPGLGLLTGGFDKLKGGLGSLNDKIQSTDFARSKTLMDYLDAKKYGGIDARDRKADQTMREARGIQTAMDMRPTTFDPREMARMGLQTIDRPTDYTDADFTNKYGYPMTAGLLDNIGVRPTIGVENTPFGSIPTGDVGLNASGRLGSLSATVDAIDALKGQSVDPQINYSGNFGNTNVYGNYSDDVQNLGLNFNNNRGLYGGVEYDAITGEPRANIGIRRTFADGGLASMFTRRG